MKVVSLTTDFGTRDYYVAMLKGKILSKGLGPHMIDVTHKIDAFNIGQAAFMVKNVYKSFPKGSIHLISVNNFYRLQPRFLAIFYDGHYFIGPDNGLFSLLFEELPEFMYELTMPQQENDKPNVVDLLQLYANATAHLLQNRPLHAIGLPTTKRLQRIALQPIIGKDYIRGAVTHIDIYENVILNIDRQLFARISNDRAFELYFKRFDPIDQLSQNYAEVPMGEALCLFNSSGLLEIAVNMGRAASLFGLKLDDTIQLDFLEEGQEASE